MKTNYLLPPCCKFIGWCMLLPFMAIFLLVLSDSSYDGDIVMKVFAVVSDDGWFKFIETGFLFEIGIVGLVSSLFLISFSREKDEDEYIEKIRLQSLVQALMISCVVLILGTLFLYGISFLVFTLLNMFILLITFVLIFNIRLTKFRNSCNE